MKKYFVFIIILMVTLASCKKDKSYMNDGVITGFDVRNCACCGGLMINFNGERESYTGEFFLIENDPSELSIDINSKFPIYIKVDWTQERVGCLPGGIGNRIRITRFQKL